VLQFFSFLKSQHRWIPFSHFCPRFSSLCQITAKRHHLILRFHSLLNTHYYHQLLLFSIFFSLFLIFSTLVIRSTFFLKFITLFHQLHFSYNFPIHRKTIIVLPYSPIHSLSLTFCLLFFSHHLKHHLHFLVFFTLFSRLWTSFLCQCLTKTSVIYKYIK
jgi:hypothetical protein